MFFCISFNSKFNISFFCFKIRKTEDLVQTDGIYVPTLKEEKKRQKQIDRYVKRRPTQVQDVPNFGEYVVDAHNEPVKLRYGFDEIELVEKEVKEKRAAGDTDAMPNKKRQMFKDEQFHQMMDDALERSSEIPDEEYVPVITEEVADAGVDYD